MKNTIEEFKNTIQKRHYVLLSNTFDYWFNASPNKIRHYQSNYRNDFCLILYRNIGKDDAYIIPFSLLAVAFTEKTLVPGTKQLMRWVGSIKEDFLQIRTAKNQINVGQFYNNFNPIENIIKPVKK